ncbi:MAG: 1-acyl-sn-glycerol-3-phosphate acyltransferase [Firmicutes bacterium]|nr:1-acyl-sn-glycerol-3-phosphate acyltransferase [Bacillota bacterium]
MAESKEKKTWIKKRHQINCTLFYPPLLLYLKLKYHIRIDRFKEEGKRPYLVLYNHQTPMDQFFVGGAFRQPLYFVSTEDLHSNGWISRLIQFMAAPIPIAKDSLDIQAIKDCLQVAREGGSIAVAPEGNRTYSGKTGFIKPGIANLAKKLKLPIVLFRIEGGYGAQPRWSDVVRKGPMHAYVFEVIESEEIAALSKDDLYERIKQGLEVNEACVDYDYTHPKAAEYLERLIYICPHCGLSEFHSHRDLMECTKCGLQVRYLPSKELKAVRGELPFRFVNDWYVYQEAYVNRLVPEEHPEQPMYKDHAEVKKVLLRQKKIPFRKDALLRLYGDRITMDEDGAEPVILPFESITGMPVLGRNKLNIYIDKQVFQIKGGKPFNAVKYIHMYHRYLNIRKDHQNGEFLGL